MIEKQSKPYAELKFAAEAAKSKIARPCFILVFELWGVSREEHLCEETAVAVVVAMSLN
jgi:hypothetical protein